MTGRSPFGSAAQWFNGDTGGQPYGSLLKDAAGDFYGTTSAGGSGNLATLFRLPDTGFAPTVPTAVGDVPEPATWGTMLLGFGRVGGTMRSRRKVRLTLA